MVPESRIFLSSDADTADDDDVGDSVRRVNDDKDEMMTVTINNNL